MNGLSWEDPLVLFLIGGLIVLWVVMKTYLEAVHVPPLVGCLVLGFLLRLGNSSVGLLSDELLTNLEFLANLGVVALLFRAGLESDLNNLLGQLKHAQAIWLGNVLLSFALGFVVSRYLLQFTVIPSLFVSVALTATSVGVPLAIWREAGALRSSNGALLLDIAELDDVSAVVLMALLLAVVPNLKDGAAETVLSTVVQSGVVLLGKLFLFGAFCFLFSRYVERRVTTFFARVSRSTARMLVVTGWGFMIAALAGFLGFSMALGAFFAGLLFSRDPLAVKIDTPFGALYDLFTPFFFIHIGLQIELDAFTDALIPGMLLLLAAVGGKVVGTVIPALRRLEGSDSLVLGVSMVPRAEIAIVVMQQGQEMGPWAVPQDAFASVIMVSAVTCVLAPLVLRWMLARWPQTEQVTS